MQNTPKTQNKKIKTVAIGKLREMLEKNRELALKLFGKSVKWQRARHTLIKCGAAVSLPLAAAEGRLYRGSGGRIYSSVGKQPGTCRAPGKTTVQNVR